MYLRVKEASALVYDCSDENVENAAPHFGHGKENSRQGRVAYVDVPVDGKLKFCGVSGTACEDVVTRLLTAERQARRLTKYLRCGTAREVSR